MKNKLSIIAILIGLAVLLVSVYTLMQLNNAVSDNVAVAETQYLRVQYPSDRLVYSDGGFWTPEVAEQIGTIASDTMPFIQFSSEAIDGRTLEEVAIEDKSLGDVVQLKDASAFNPPFDEQNNFGYKTISRRNVLWVHVAEKFDVTTYYFEEDGLVHSFTTLFSNDEYLQLVEDMIASVEVK